MNRLMPADASSRTETPSGAVRIDAGAERPDGFC
jgi:hypothetical protein